MRIVLTLLVMVFILQGCHEVEKIPNQFSSSSDTLVIRTQKQKGNGGFVTGATSLRFEDSLELFPYELKFPEKLADIKRYQMHTDFKAEEPQYIDIVHGTITDKELFIVDENNNKDLTDDLLRTYDDFKWDTSANLVPVTYKISNGQTMVQDSSWLQIGMGNGRLLLGKNEHLTAVFSINEEDYKVAIHNPRNILSFAYAFDPIIALLSDNTQTKDTLLEKDLLKKGEFLNLKGQHYRFDGMSNNGEYVTLIKEHNFEDKIGTQIGMIAPDFDFVTVAGDSISSSELHDKVLVIANSCGCGGDQFSTEAFYKIDNAYTNKAHILHLDSGIEKGLEGLHIEMEEDYNKSLYDQFRQAYCSRLSYVVGMDNRILDKFPITDWETFLPKTMENITY